MKDICKPDRRSEIFSFTEEQIEADLSEISISDKVPPNIQDMVEFAKKICLYGYYEYDFFALSSIYLFLLAETAIKVRFLSELPQECTLSRKRGSKSEQISVRKNYTTIYKHLFSGWRIEGFKGIRTLRSIVRWLKNNQILPNRISEQQIDNIIDLRNDVAAHLGSKEIYTPAQVIEMFWLIIDFVNCLFDPQVHAEEPEVLVRTKESYRRIFEIAKKHFEKIDRE